MPATLNLPEKKVIKAYKSGMAIKEVASQFGCSTYPICGILKRNGVKRRPSGTRLQHLLPGKSLADEYESGKTLQELADKYGCSRIAITKKLKFLGVSLRPRGSSKTHRLPVDKINKLYAGGMPARELASLYGVGLGTIRRIVSPRKSHKAKYGIGITEFPADVSPKALIGGQKGKKKESRREMAFGYFSSGFEPEQVANAMGIKPSSAKLYLMQWRKSRIAPDVSHGEPKTDQIRKFLTEKFAKYHHNQVVVFETHQASSDGKTMGVCEAFYREHPRVTYVTGFQYERDGIDESVAPRLMESMGIKPEVIDSDPFGYHAAFSVNVGALVKDGTLVFATLPRSDCGRARGNGARKLKGGEPSKAKKWGLKDLSYESNMKAIQESCQSRGFRVVILDEVNISRTLCRVAFQVFKK